MSTTTAQDEAITTEINRQLPEGRVWICRKEHDGATVHECIFEYGSLRRYESSDAPIYDVDGILNRFERWLDGAKYHMRCRQWVEYPEEADDLSGAPWND